MLIGLIGYAGSGKDYTAGVIRELVATENVKVYKFADPLKSFCRKVFNWTEDHTDGDLKEKPDDNGVIPRVAMQKLGADWGRELYRDIWVDYTLREIYRDMTTVNTVRSNMGWKLDRVDVAIVTDVRFPNEGRKLKECGAHLLFIDGGGSRTAHSYHTSETSIDETRSMADVYVDNVERNREILRVQLHTWLFGRVELK